jgi:hypothetical protein
MKAIQACRVFGAKLFIAELDRLSRDAHFLLGLEKAGVDFVAADMPQANRLTVGIMAMRPKRRDGAFLLDKQCRVDRVRRIVHQIKLRLPRKPRKSTAVLVQHLPFARLARPLAAVRHAAPHAPPAPPCAAAL